MHSCHHCDAHAYHTVVAETVSCIWECRVAQRAMQALSEAFETILQFLELVHAEGSGASQDSPWLLAAIRAYGRQVCLFVAYV